MVFTIFDSLFGLVPAINLQQKFQIFRGFIMVIENIIFTYDSFFIILEYMYMAIRAYTDMSSIVTISNVYISYLNKAEFHHIFNGSTFFIWLDESLPSFIVHAYRDYSDTYSVYKGVTLCEIDLPTIAVVVYSREG